MNKELVRAGGEAGVPSAERMFQEMHALINMLRCQTFSNPGSGTGFDLAIYPGPTLLWSGSYDSTICARPQTSRSLNIQGYLFLRLQPSKRKPPNCSNRTGGGTFPLYGDELPGWGYKRRDLLHRRHKRPGRKQDRSHVLHLLSCQAAHSEHDSFPMFSDPRQRYLPGMHETSSSVYIHLADRAGGRIDGRQESWSNLELGDQQSTNEASPLPQNSLPDMQPGWDTDVAGT